MIRKRVLASVETYVTTFGTGMPCLFALCWTLIQWGNTKKIMALVNNIQYIHL